MALKLFGWSVIPVLLASTLFYGGCRQEAVSRTGGENPPEAKPVAGSATRPAWEEGWLKTVASGKKEGRMLVYNTQGSEFRTAVGKAFKEQYGIDIEWEAGREAELTLKLKVQRGAGLYLVDIFMTGGTVLNQLNDAGFLEPQEPSLMLPEVVDPKSWLGGSLYFLDAERKILPFYSRTGSTILINTEMVKAEDLKSYRGLLEPRWKGKIIVNDPTIPGAGNSFFAPLLTLMGPDFLRELARQEPLITRDQRQQIEWIARGKNPILLGPHVETMAEFRKAGAPIKHIVPEVEGGWSGAGGGMIGLLSQAPHPAAARVFLNWFLTREGQTVAVKSASEQSRRVDVSTEFIDPDRRLQTGLKYLDGDSKANIQKKAETMVLTKEIFAAQLK